MKVAWERSVLFMNRTDMGLRCIRVYWDAINAMFVYL